MTSFTGQIVDVEAGRIFPGRIRVENATVAEIREDPAGRDGPFFLPGFVDAHVHVESSLLAPTEFARAASIHGTVATLSDPHEIANVCGLEGVRWMIENAQRTPLKIHFGAPSCVPATPFETAGAHFGPGEVDELLAREDILYLSEVMNFPGVIGGDPAMHAILDKAKTRGKRIDGHAPGVVDDALKTYAAAGIETDHECVSLDEARQRAALGMKVAIREGSAARNFEALWPLLREYPEQCFFCSDDKHPDELVVSHINALLQRAIAYGVDTMTALRAATLNPIRHYGLPVGLLQPGDPADFVQARDLESFQIIATWIDGEEVARQGQSTLPRLEVEPINNFQARPIQLATLRLPARENGTTFATIVAEDGQLVTGREDITPRVHDGEVIADPARDLLKIAVLNRYEPDATPALGLIRNIGLRTGAMAGSVAHDSHNIVAVGANDKELARAINAVIEVGGGLAFTSPTDEETFPLPIAGLMSDREAWEAAAAFERLTDLARSDGCPLGSPYMTLAFMALLVIPALKLGDKGHFDVDSFSLVEPWGED